MLFSPKESLEDRIVRTLLQEGKTTPSQLYKSVQKEGVNVTLQALYKALRFLAQNKVVLKANKEVVINQEWVDLLSGTRPLQNTLPKLQEKETITWSFKSLSNLDAFWKQVSRAAKEQFPGYPLYIYNPQNIWYYLPDRKQSEINFFNSFAKEKRYGFLVSGNDTNYDKQIKTKFQNEFLQIDTRITPPWPGSDHTTVIGDLILTTKLAPHLSGKIINMYQSGLTVGRFEQELQHIVSVPYPVKLKLECNSQKAKKLRKKLSQHFFVPAKIRLQYELF